MAHKSLGIIQLVLLKIILSDDIVDSPHGDLVLEPEELENFKKASKGEKNILLNIDGIELSDADGGETIVGKNIPCYVSTLDDPYDVITATTPFFVSKEGGSYSFKLSFDVFVDKVTYHIDPLSA